LDYLAGLFVFSQLFWDDDIFLFGSQDIKQLCSYLLDLKRASAEEMRRSVYANYPAFIRLADILSVFSAWLFSLKLM
jgi:hypothetical protein